MYKRQINYRTANPVIFETNPILKGETESDLYVLVGSMRADAENSLQGKEVGGIGIKVAVAQASHESDITGPDYDLNAEYLADAKTPAELAAILGVCIPNIEFKMCIRDRAYEVEEIENGMRVTAPFRTICNRACALDVGTLTFEFTSADEDIISVRCFHFEGYEKREPRFMLNREKCIVNVDISEDEAVMSAGNVSVHVGLKEFYISYKRSGKDMTSCGFKNVGYMRHDRKNSTKYPETNYLAEDYKPYIVSEFSLAAGECVYGLGERFTAFVKNGQTCLLYTSRCV